MTTEITVADALVAALVTAGFTEAERKPIPYLELSESAGRKCVVMVRQKQYDDGTRKSYDTAVELIVAIQKGVNDPFDNDAVDPLLADVRQLVALWADGGALRNVSLGGAMYDTGPEHPTGNLYEPSQLVEFNLFTSITSVTYEIV